MATMLYLNRSASTQIVSPESPLYAFLENDIWSFLGGDRVTNLLPLNGISLAFVFAVSSFTDVFAFFVGSLFGKHKLCPEISPKKTVEGSVGGIVGGAFRFGACILFVRLFQSIRSTIRAYVCRLWTVDSSYRCDVRYNRTVWIGNYANRRFDSKPSKTLLRY